MSKKSEGNKVHSFEHPPGEENRNLKGTELRNRVVSAAVMLAAIVACCLISELTRVLFFAAAGMLCAYEYAHRFREKGILPAVFVIYAFLAVETVLCIFHAEADIHWISFAASVFAAMTVGTVSERISGKGALCTLGGLVYPGFVFATMLRIVSSPLWKETLIFACLCTWMCDNTAYLVGKRFGRHRIAPHISPHKTVEGCVSGAAGAVFTGAVIYFLKLVPGISLPVCLGIALICSTMGQLGDAAESSVKRMLQIKDFSNLIPGHGGMLDRADSLMFSIPTAFICLKIAGL